ncbi:MAG: hypothetical protein CMH54_03800 [Myxococcales bacterium]|nr:hypothetical protein [Myxococcales bacterium]|tara:strand:- start:760 stop:1359 length:600 start_codon:yes stop_codon:yes gene_type:complete
MTKNKTLNDLLYAETPDLASLEALFSDANPADRYALVCSLSGKDQARLWELCDGQSVGLTHLVPEGTSTDQEVIHQGKNSLPVFSLFEKRFVRIPDTANEVYGYNEGSTRKFVGPGFFVAGMDDTEGTIGIDYYRVPPQDTSLPTGWPKIQVNEKGVSRFVYAKMIDYLRRVSPHVSVGRAVRKGKLTNNYFVLCRKES